MAEPSTDADDLLDQHHGARDNGRCQCEHCGLPVEDTQRSLRDRTVVVHRHATMSQVQAFLETQDDPLDPDETTVYEALASLNLPGPSVEPPTFRELMDEIARSGSRPLSDVTVWRVLTVEERL